MRAPATPAAGAALGAVLHAVLLLLVLGQAVFLASRYRTRLDLTADGAYTLTGSTRDLVANLDQSLLIECYFSPKEQLPSIYRETRTLLDNFLDELVQVSRGRVILRRINPLDDKDLAETATNLQIKPMDLADGTASSRSISRHWQGLRLVHGGEKQKVLDQVVEGSPFQVEARITPAIKEVVSRGLRRIGFMEWPLEPAPGGRSPAFGWNRLRTVDEIARRYQFQQLKDQEGALIPDDVPTLVLFHPKDLTDRQKYVVDQFLLRGGTLVVLADAVDYQIGEQRTFHRVPLAFDAPGSEHPFLAQMAHYGVAIQPKVVADLMQEAQQPRNPFQQPFEYFSVLRPMGQQMVAQWKRYPYFFHAVAFDWSQTADRLATDPKTGTVDQALAEQYRRFRPGIDSDEFLWKPFKQVGRGPGFYWPCPVDLVRDGREPKLPAGVEGRVLLWSSPVTLVEDPPPSLNPAVGHDIPTQEISLQKFDRDLIQRFQAEPRRQVPLMVDLRGSFPSFFAGKERPKTPAEIKEAEARKQEAEKPGEDPLQQPVQPDPDKAKTEEPAKPGQPEVGPPPPTPAEAEAAAAAEAASREPRLEQATARGRIVVIGDSDFLRDDLVQGTYVQRGGPCSLMGGAFWLSMLDWLSEDRDLIELQARAPVDRTMRFVAEPTPGQGTEQTELERRADAKGAWLLFANVLLPALLLGLIGLLVQLSRRAQKRSFLATVER